MKMACLLSYGLAGTAAVASLGGAFSPATYAREAPAWAAEGVGQDAVNLVLIIPLLLVSAFMTRKGSKLFFFILGGVLVYFLYSYCVYAFCVHFNSFFFAYCASFGLSVYALLLLGTAVNAEEVKSWFDDGRSVMVPAIYFLGITGLFYALWLAEDIPAVVTGQPPKSLAASGLITNPVHVLDLSIVLPASLAASIALLRKRPVGYLLFPVMMIFSIVLAIAIAGMVVAMRVRGVSGDLAPAAVFGIVIIFSTLALASFLRSFTRKPAKVVGLQKSH
jgi:hypothetical protein